MDVCRWEIGTTYIGLCCLFYAFTDRNTQTSACFVTRVGAKNFITYPGNWLIDQAITGRESESIVLLLIPPRTVIPPEKGQPLEF